MSSFRYVSTGFGPTSSEVGMFEPVTTTSSMVTPERSGVCGVGEASWPNIIGAQSRKAAAVQIPSRPINGRFITRLSLIFRALAKRR